MAKRPSFQFYPADWRNNAKLRRCSEAARGAWMDVLCILHDSDEYGVCRWPLADLARAAGVPLKLVKELADKDVLKGADKNAKPYVYTPRHAGKDGEPVALVVPEDGPCWYCSRFVRDEWVRQRRGQSSQFSSDNQPPKGQPKTAPKSSPKGGIGERQGDGSTSTSSSTENPSIPDGMDADASMTGLDAKDAIWQIAVPWLLERQVADKSARSLLGAAIKQLGSDEAAWSLCQRMFLERPIEPAAWLAGAINAHIKPTAARQKGGRQDALEQANRDVAAQVAAEIEGAGQ
ncbi:hypothetical protein ACI2VP_05105 [Ralstonia nicotianae]|uniref:hypothetical protein n=1 Tax=Ralstonia nicotianae TaxID=3037696 RepID=UPI0039A097BD